MERRKRNPELRVVFDTSALYTKAASDLFNAEVTSLINNNSFHTDLKISWYLPEMVRCEREFQMRHAALDLLPNVEKLERLLGHNLNITPDILETRVRDAIERPLNSHNIQVLPLSVENVDWNQLILNAAYRRPPFDAGQYEKGFRDAIIVEIFLQLVERSPKTPKICRLALVSKDNLLSVAAKARTESKLNVKIVRTIAELEGLINTLVSNVTEEFIEGIQEIAKKLFFQRNDKDTLYYKESLRAQVRETFSDELAAVPVTGQSRENGNWYIGPPNFVKKEGQRVFWSSSIEVEADIYRYKTQFESSPALGGIFGASIPSGIFPGGGGGLLDPITAQHTTSVTIPISSTSSTAALAAALSAASPPEKLKVGSGKSIFEITWSVQVSQARRFSKVNIESIDFIETIWE